MIRLFAAIPVPAEVGRPLQSVQAGVESARWRSLPSLHVTLRFFGDIPEDRAADVDAELAIISARPFALSLQGVGAFGEGARLSAVWAGVAASDPLRHLAERCETAARRAGLKPETRNFHPHVTLAYLTRPNPADVAAWIQANNLLRSEPFVADSFSLMSSSLLGAGSVYETERAYRLL